MKNSQKIIFLALNICLLNTSKILSQPAVTPIINRPTLQIGSQGNIVSELQGVLKLLGYYQGKIDGKYSDEIKIAVANFQTAAGLTSTGIVDSLTWETLLPSKPPTNNSSVVVTNSNNDNQKPVTNNNNTNITPVENTNQKPVTNNNNTNITPVENTNQKPVINNNNTNQKPQLIAENMPLLKEGMSGESVKILQEKLKNLGFFQGIIDGVFGVETLQAVFALQTKHNLGVDGIVGQQTWQILLGQ